MAGEMFEAPALLHRLSSAERVGMPATIAVYQPPASVVAKASKIPFQRVSLMHELIHGLSPLTVVLGGGLWGRQLRGSRETLWFGHGGGTGGKGTGVLHQQMLQNNAPPRTAGRRRPEGTHVPVELCDGVCIFLEDHLGAGILKDPTQSSQSTRETKSPGTPDSAGRTEQ